MYQIGELQNPMKDDPEVERYGQALIDAQEMAEDTDDLIGVWEKDSGDLKAVIYQGGVFEK